MSHTRDTDGLRRGETFGHITPTQNAPRSSPDQGISPGRQQQKSFPGSARSTHHSIARWLIAQGYHVHPLVPGGKFPPAGCLPCRKLADGKPNPQYVPHEISDCSCIAAGGICHGVRAATSDPATVDRWWAENPRYGVGVATGPSNLVVVDLDCHRADPPEDITTFLPGVTLPEDLVPASIWHGEDTLALLCEIRRAELLTLCPTTLAIETPSGGKHLWYRVADGREWRPNGMGALGWQVDIRAGWSYAVAPGVTTSAGTYTRISDTHTPEQLPTWLAAELTRVGLRKPPAGAPAPRRPRAAWRSPDIGSRGYVAAAVSRELDAVASCRSGISDQLTKSAFSLGQLVGAGLLDSGAVHQALTDAAAAAGVDPGESKAQSTISRSIEAGASKPRRIGAQA